MPTSPGGAAEAQQPTPDVLETALAVPMSQQDTNELLDWLCSAADGSSTAGPVQRATAMRLLAATLAHSAGVIDRARVQHVGTVLAHGMADVDPVVHRAAMRLLLALYGIRNAARPELAVVLSAVVTPILSCQGVSADHTMTTLQALHDVGAGIPDVVVELHANLDSHLPCGDVIQVQPQPPPQVVHCVQGAAIRCGCEAIMCLCHRTWWTLWPTSSSAAFPPQTTRMTP